MPPSLGVLLWGFLLPGLIPAGCLGPLDRIDVSLVHEARLALLQERPPRSLESEEEMDPFEDEEEAPPRRSVLVGELLAIFPGFFWHGLGHQYAGDKKTARELRKAGEWGYLLTALGAGMAAGGYFLDKSGRDVRDNYALSLYIAGGVTGGVGSVLWLTVWFYDMIDTPRAIKSGGRPPHSSPFTRDLEEMGER